MIDQPANAGPAPVSDEVPGPPLEYVETISELSTIEASPLTPDYQLALQLAVDIAIARVGQLGDHCCDPAVITSYADKLLDWLNTNNGDGSDET